MKPVLLINPNSSEQTTQAMTVITRRYLPDVLGWTNTKGPSMIADVDELREAAPVGRVDQRQPRGRELHLW